MGRVSKRSRLNISQSSNSEQLVDDEHYLYDANGRLIESKNQDSRIQLFYDSLGNLQKEHHRYLFLGKENTFVWRHQYDVLGNRTETLRPDGHRVAYLRYGSGHLHGMTLNQHEIIAYQRDRLHRETERQMGLLNQQTIYDTMGRITQQNRLGINPRQRHYRYDMAGQMSHIRDSKNGTIRYQYDPLGQLIEAVTPLRHEQFAFDPAGNRLDGLSGSHTEKTTTLNRVWGNLLKNWLGKHYEYDQRGNLLAKSENGKQETFRWNSYNRLIQYTKDNQTTEYKYDPFGRRIAKIHNGTTTLYHWDGDVLAAESNANSTTHYIFEPDTFEPVAQFVSAPLRPQTPLTFRDYTYYTPEIDPLNQEPTPQEYLPDSLAYFHLDHLGTPIEMTDRAGKTVWEATYQAWGEVEMVSGSLKQPFRFQGQYFDEESGLHYNRFRYYDPSSGRFVSQDPIRLLGGFNLYEYAPNPISWLDPLGLCKRKSINIEQIIKKYGGKHIVSDYYEMPSRVAAKQAASEIAGNLTSKVHSIRKRDFRGGPKSWKDSMGVIGKDSGGDNPCSGWRDDSLGHIFKDDKKGHTEIPAHFNAWNKSAGIDNVHLLYKKGLIINGKSYK